MLAPLLAELEREYPDIKFCKINVDEERSLAAEFRVESIPMVAFVKDDTFLDMSVGLVPKESLVSLLEEYK
jgi:thioredoxin 1